MADRKYRNPKFLIDHAFQSAELIAIANATEDPDAPVDPRIIDELNGSPAKVATTGINARLEITRSSVGAVMDRTAIDRIIVSGTNFQALKVECRWSAETDTTLHSLDMVNNFGENPIDAFLRFFVMTGAYRGIVDFIPRDEASDLDEARPFEWVLIYKVVGENSPVDIEIGEVFAGKELTTTSGHVHVWSDVFNPATRVVETDARNVFNVQRGDERRVWELTYRAINDIDAQILDSIHRKVGLQNHSFWFDPPSSGNIADADIFPMTSTAGWNFNGPATITWVPVGSGEEMFIDWTSGSGSVNLDLVSPVDLSGKLLVFDAFLLDDTWLVNSLSLTFEIANISVGNAINTYSVSDYFIGSIYSQNQYRRIVIDPERDLLVGGGVPLVDLRSIDSIRFRMVGTPSAEVIKFKNFRVVDVNELPQFVELMSYNKRQASAHPGARLAWDIDMQLRGVTS